MTTPPFVHLHCHSHYSLLDGASPIDAMVARAKELGMNALAITDHGNLYGALEFYTTCRDAGINPIVGYEAYVAPGSRREKATGAKGETSFHLTLLAANRTGFNNLMQLSSKAFLEGFYHKPRIDRELLEQFNEGIICLSGCVSGELSRSLLSGNTADEAFARGKDHAEWFHGVFGDRYYIEIQDNGLDIQRQAKDLSVDLANRMGLPLVATSDAHYVNREDAVAQDVLLCINTGKFRTDTNRMRMEGDQFYVRAPQEMYDAFPGLHDAVARSQQIADSVDLQLELGNRHFPTFVTPPEKTKGEYLRELCEAGLRERYAEDPQRWHSGDVASGQFSDEVKQRLDREIYVIETLGFPDYFLIVWDFVRHAVERGIPCTARGSGVGSLVCYALKISHVCPLRYDLLFERFLDENRREAPDIDIDFCKERRGEVIQYVKEKYGEANVAQIGTFGTLAARAAIRDVGRTLGIPIFRVDQIVAMVPDQLGISLDDALEQSDELKKTYNSDGEVRELIDLARKIEGLARNVGTHAAAVVIAEKPVEHYVPLQYVKGKTEVITQWAMGDVERAGLLKMDFLGLRNLTILAKAVELIEQSRGERVDPHKFPLDDKETFALLCRGETKGIFQLESGGIRDLLQRMKPDHFRDIIATNALYRPGPLEGGMVDEYIEVKHGRKQPFYPHAVMKDVLEETHGVMVFQEQVMRIINLVGDIPLADAYTCIKAISKKKLPMIAKFREQFIEGAREKGLEKKKAEELFGQIEKFAGYGFNKSHSTAYALIAYQTAYLKAHFPVEFMAALLSGDIPGRNFKSKDALVEHLEDCKRMQVEVVPPDVNRSEVDFAVSGDKILFGLSAIKGCGSGASEAIVVARRDGVFTSLFSFCERLDPQECGRAVMETLVKAGAFDSLGAKRSQLMAVIDRAMQSGAAVLADRRSGQRGLFMDAEDEPSAAFSSTLPDVPEFGEKERLAMEKEVLGFYLSSHPLAEHEATLRTFCTHMSPALPKLEARTDVLVGGMLAAIKFSHTKNPRPGSTNTKYAMWDLEDLEGIVRCILWPEQFAEFGEHVKADAILAMRARVDKRPGVDEVNLIIEELIPLDDLSARFTSGVLIRVREDTHGMDVLPTLREIVRGYPGTKPLRLRLELADGGCALIDAKGGVAIDPELRRRVEELLGEGNFRLQGGAPKYSVAPQNGNGRRRVMARSQEFTLYGLGRATLSDAFYIGPVSRGTNRLTFRKCLSRMMVWRPRWRRERLGPIPILKLRLWCISRGTLMLLFVRTRAFLIAVAVVVLTLASPVSAAVVVSGDTELSPFEIEAGVNSLGTLRIDAGSVQTTGRLRLGTQQFGVGLATVTGVGSQLNLNNSNFSEIGEIGLGRLEILNGALVNTSSTSGSLRIGGSGCCGGPSHGTVIVDGPGSMLLVSNDLLLGINGTGILQINNGAIVNAIQSQTQVNSLSRIEMNGGLLRINSLSNDGVIKGSGEIVVGSMSGSGRYEAGPGQMLKITGGNSFSNAGIIAADGGEIELARNVFNNINEPAQGEITLRDATIRVGEPGFGGTALQNSSVLAAIGGTNDFYGGIINTSTGRIAVTNNSVMIFHDDVAADAGTITVFPGSSAVFLEDLTMSGSSVLLADLAGTGADTGFGEIEVVGTATLNSSLSVTLAEGFTPQAGDSFPILAASNIEGAMSLGDMAALPSGLKWSLEREANRVLLSVVPGLEGDYNSDGAVDTGDYVVWRKTVGQQGSGLPADGDSDGEVEGDDYFFWQERFGTGLSGGGSDASVAVPEPCGAVLILLGFALVHCRRSKLN